MPCISNAVGAFVGLLTLVAIAPAPVRAQYYGNESPNEAAGSYDYATVGGDVDFGGTYATAAPSVVRVTGIDVIPAYHQHLDAEAYADETPHPLDQPAPSPGSSLYGAVADDSVVVAVDTIENSEPGSTTTDGAADGTTTGAATDDDEQPPSLPDYSVRALNVSAAIFEHIAPVQFYTQRWRIQAQVQLPDFSESLDAIDRYDELVRQVCDGFLAQRKRQATQAAAKALANQKTVNRRKSNATTRTTTTTTTTTPLPVMGADLRAHCQNAEREVSMLTERVRATNVELRKVTASTASRRRSRGKRSVDAVADATATDSPGRQFYLAVEEVVNDKLFDRVELLEREAQWGFRLMKNELRVLRGTNNAVYKTVWKLTDVQKENDANIRRMVRKLRSLRGAVAREADELQARLTLVELVQLISLELTGLVEQQNEVLSLVTTSAAGRLHPMVMGVAELNRFYANVSQTMGLSGVLAAGGGGAFDGDDLLPQMVSIRSTQDGRNMRVHIEVPMVRREEFQLYRAYALPRRLPAADWTQQRRQRQPTSVVLEDEYLAVNEADGTFVPMSADEVATACKAVGARDEEDGGGGGDEPVRYVCKLTGPLYTSGADSCVISLFQQRPLDETPCELRAVSRRDTVQKMRMASTWLWLAANASTARVRCANRRHGGAEEEDEEVLVPAQSIVQLNGLCELEAQTFRLRAESTVFRNATVLQSKQMVGGSNIAALDELAMHQATAQPVFASHDIDQDPIRLTQPRQYHRWLNENGRAITALARSFRQVDAARKKGKQDLAQTPEGGTDYFQIILTVGQVALRVVKLIVRLVTRFMGEADDDIFF